MGLGLRRIGGTLLRVLIFSSMGLLTAPTSFADESKPDAPDHLSWPQDGSDLKPDPRIEYGVLANGMRYAIRRNTTPAGSAAINLRIAAGSLHEREDEQGLAHYLEHLAFQGSKNVPRGEMVKRLQRLGLAVPTEY